MDQPLRLHESRRITLGRGYRRIRILHYRRSMPGELVLKWVKPSSILEVIPSDRFYFSLGDHFFITGLPDGYTVKIIPLRENMPEKKCVSAMNICVVNAPWREQPLEAYVSIYSEAGRVFARFSEPFTFFGGDEYTLQVI